MSLTGRSGHTLARAEAPAISVDAAKPRNSRRRMPISEPQQSTAQSKPIFMAFAANATRRWTTRAARQGWEQA
jgi:hypothetical protein